MIEKVDEIIGLLKEYGARMTEKISENNMIGLLDFATLERDLEKAKENLITFNILKIPGPTGIQGSKKVEKKATQIKPKHEASKSLSSRDSTSSLTQNIKSHFKSNSTLQSDEVDKTIMKKRMSILKIGFKGFSNPARKASNHSQQTSSVLEVSEKLNLTVSEIVQLYSLEDYSFSKVYFSLNSSFYFYLDCY